MTVSPDTPPEPTRRARRRTAIQARLIAATRALVAERGVADVRVTDIAERADVAAGSFYTYFDSKESIIEAVIVETVTGLVEAVVGHLAQVADPAESMSVVARLLMRLPTTDRELASLLVGLDGAEARFEAMMMQQSLLVLRQGVQSGRFNAHDEHATATVAIGGMFAAVRAILDGQLPAGADVGVAAALLQSVGVETSEAIEIAGRPFPELLLSR